MERKKIFGPNEIAISMATHARAHSHTQYTPKYNKLFRSKTHNKLFIVECLLLAKKKTLIVIKKWPGERAPLSNANV